MSIYLYCLTFCTCFSQVSLLVLLYLLHFSVFLLLSLSFYVKLDNSFCYQPLAEVCKFLHIFILTFWHCVYNVLKKQNGEFVVKKSKTTAPSPLLILIFRTLS